MIVNSQLALQYGLTQVEYDKIINILGRVPTYTELGIFSVMWSEHCSYKSSIAELKKLPRTGPCLLVDAGEENAGLVDIGEGMAIAFKIESHNHPSAVEPYQGAATGVGGIMRDIFTMGARPIAALNSLRFGSLNNPRTIFFMKGIVKGIGDYGNSFGVPTVAGDVFFDNSFNDNPLVNAMAVGIVRHEDVTHAIASGESNLVMIVGSLTGRDGIHGATFASEEISEKSESKRPSVQVGDPFTEKLLLEATLEIIRQKLVIGLQDMGAAGLTCSTSEMSAKGNVGMEIELDRVPLREDSMTPYEIMLSESQERMLLVVSPENAKEVKKVFIKWDLPCEVIGIVTSDGILRVKKSGVIHSEIPAAALVLGGGAPIYHLESRQPEYLSTVQDFNFSELPEPTDYAEAFLKVLSSPNICSKDWIISQYDSMVRTNTISITADAAILRIKETERGIAVKTDCNSRYVYLNPYRGAQIAVVESARNVVAVGALPLAITNCLNFGNPNDPEMYWQFKEAVRGIGDACRELNVPVTGGNVSFYNESPTGPIFPSPVIGMLGLIPDISRIMTSHFKKSGDIILLLGVTRGNLGGSEYMATVYGKIAGNISELDFLTEKRLHKLIYKLISENLIKSAHDISDGGIAVALAESCLGTVKLNKNLGAQFNLSPTIRMDQFLFSEDQSRFIVSCSPLNSDRVKKISDTFEIECHIIGEVIPNRFIIDHIMKLELSEMAETHRRGFNIV
jgi:phosphoribosylformylglycinamidine synthase II